MYHTSISYGVGVALAVVIVCTTTFHFPGLILFKRDSTEAEIASAFAIGTPVADPSARVTETRDPG